MCRGTKKVVVSPLGEVERLNNPPYGLETMDLVL